MEQKTNEFSNTFSKTQLKEMADELAIDERVLEQSIGIWRSQKTQNALPKPSMWQTLLLGRPEPRQSRLWFYRQRLVPYLAVNTFLLSLNFSIAGAITYAIYPALGWGLSLFFPSCRSLSCQRSSKTASTSTHSV